MQAQDPKTMPFGIPFTSMSVDAISREIASTTIANGQGVRMLATANVDHIVRLKDDQSFAAAYRFAWKVTADGMPVYWYARMRGLQLPGRVTGADIFQALMPLMRPARHRPFFVVATHEVAEKLAAEFAAMGFSQDAVGFAVPPRGFESDAARSDQLSRSIREHHTTHLFFCMGAPKSEKWIHRYQAALGDCYALPVGAAAEFHVGAKRRAPHWVQAIGFEWFWRLMSEPRRLFNRYLVNSWRIIGIAVDDARVGRSLLAVDDAVDGTPHARDHALKASA